MKEKSLTALSGIIKMPGFQLSKSMDFSVDYQLNCFYNLNTDVCVHSARVGAAEN